MPIIGPIPNTKSTNFAEFFVWPNFWSFEFDLTLIFFDLLLFMNNMLLQRNFKRFWFVAESEIIFSLIKFILESKKDRDV